MKLIIGLGNPGEKYERNRHNVGFIVIDKLRKKWGFPEFKFSKKFNAEISEGIIQPPLPPGEGRGEGIIKSLSRSLFSKGRNRRILVKPQTFMNNSGETVQKILAYYKLRPEDLIIIHDDLDIEIGNYKISEDSSAAGHNGVQDIMNKLGAQEFRRIRIGIGGPSRFGKPQRAEAGRQNRKISGESFVLQDFTEEEYEKIINLIPNIEKEVCIT